MTAFYSHTRAKTSTPQFDCVVDHAITRSHSSPHDMLSQLVSIDVVICQEYCRVRVVAATARSDLTGYWTPCSFEWDTVDVLYNIYTILFYLQYLQGVRPSSFMSDRILPVTWLPSLSISTSCLSITSLGMLPEAQ